MALAKGDEQRSLSPPLFVQVFGSDDRSGAICHLGGEFIALCAFDPRASSDSHRPAFAANFGSPPH